MNMKTFWVAAMAAMPACADTPETTTEKPKTNKGKVTVVEAFEFACPYCAMMEPTMEALQERYRGDSVAFEPKQFVVHPNVATMPALAVCAANRLGEYDKYEDELWRRSWGTNMKLVRQELERDKLVATAVSVGLDRQRFEAALDGAECKAELEQDRKQLIAMGVRGTPTLFINGQRYQGPRTVDALAQAIEAARLP